LAAWIGSITRGAGKKPSRNRARQDPDRAWAARAGYGWTPWLFGAVAATTDGAVLRAAGRVFLGLRP